LAALSGCSKLYHKIFPFEIYRNCTSPPNLTPDPNLGVTHMVISIWRSWTETGFEVGNTRQAKLFPLWSSAEHNFRLM